MHKHQNTALWTFVAAESIHVFCCVLPMTFSVLSLLAGFGFISSMPAFMTTSHNLIHNFELPIMTLSTVVIAMGWGFYCYSRKLDCSKTVCEHAPCAPKKQRTHIFLIAATVLFTVNIGLYFLLHA